MKKEASKPENNVEKEISLELRHIKKDYYVDKKPFTAIKDLSLCFPKKGFVAILGASGSGKTTLLNIIGGLDHYTEGDLLIDGKSTKGFTDPEWDAYRNKRVGFVFQSYNLIPHFTVEQNVEVSLQLAGVSPKERNAKALQVLERVGLSEYAKKKPNQLSGGQMQRVAIARALINDPDIILADEPTGALDSVTSVQVMDLIKEVGKDRCVIMVTHNRELANQYADRIITMKDGEIDMDSDPLLPKENGEEAKQINKKTSMSFFAALKSSFNNVLTKKGRTVLTAVACSFGIIGVALVLATSNGFSIYINKVEASIASSVPISITPTSYRAIMGATVEEEEFPKEKEVKVYNPNTQYYVSHKNDYNAEYFEYLNRILDDPKCPAYGSAMSIMYNRLNLDFHFLTEDGLNSSTSNPIYVNQYASAGVVGNAISSVTGLPATIIHELYGQEDKLATLYDTIEGRFPTKPDELALIVDKYNRIDFSTMKRLGFYPSSANADVLKNDNTISFSDILYEGEGDSSYKLYKAYTNSNYFDLENAEWHTLDAECWTNVRATYNEDTKEVSLTGDASTHEIKAIQAPTYRQVYSNDEKYKPIECKIVGVLRPTKDSYIQLMPASLAYVPELKDIMAKDQENPLTKQLATYQQNDWVLPRVEIEGQPGVYDPDQDGLLRLKSILETLVATYGSFEESSEDAASMASSLSTSLGGVFRFFSAIGYDDTRSSYAYSTSPSAYLGLCRSFGADIETDYAAGDAAAIGQALFTTDFFSPDSDINVMGFIAYYNSYSLITSILIFPESLTTKDALRAYLDAWNEGKTDSEQILYSDIMNDFTGSLGTMIKVISAVLIVFASISLVVSSVMTAIITYISVIERTKEIGVLRACGARKKDVGRLFEAECVIVGFVAGLIGIVFTIVACFPINAILDHQFPGNHLEHIAQLNPWHALLLIGISILLAFLSGLIPSRVAARKDPVVCLRSE